MKILVVSESQQGRLHRATREAVAGAQHLTKETTAEVSILVLGADAKAQAEEACGFDVAQVLRLNHALLERYSADAYTFAVGEVIRKEDPDLVLFGHTYQVRDYAPRLSASLDRALVSDVTSMAIESGKLSLFKPAFHGKLSAQIDTANESPLLVSIQSAAYAADAVRSGSAPMQEVHVDLEPALVRSESEAPFQEEAGDVDLTAAGILVSVGRGIGNKENLPVAFELAKAMGGEVSSSRPVVDAGWLPSYRQVGSSGQTVSPQLYLALGISGAIQHLVGMKGAKSIVAINTDSEAPIFDVADYGVVGDVLEIVPALTEALR